MNNRDIDRTINYCKADNKVLNYKCPGCSFFKEMDADIYTYMTTLDTTLLK